MRLMSKYLITIGLLCIIFGIFLLWERNNPKRLSFQQYSSTNYSNYNVIPVRIYIPSVNINLPVVQSTIQNNQWPNSTEGISYLTSSPLPGKKGNSILYGHNWNNLLGNLKDTKPGEKIEIEYSDGTIKVFSINAMGVVTPDQTHVLLPSNDVRITLYTCTGFLDTKRLVVTALLENTISNNAQLAERGFYEK